MTPATVTDWISFILLGGILGGLGQVIRAVAGLKKSQDANVNGAADFAANFEPSVFVVSLIIGFTAGALACLAATFPATLDAKFLLTFIAAGYAGADFIEAFIKRQSAGPIKSQSPADSSKGAGTAASPGRADMLFSAPPARRSAAGFAMSTEDAVIQCIADVKHISPDSIALSDKLSDLQFDHAGRRDLANEINDFFHRLNLVFDTLMHPSETDADQTVSDVIQKVVAKHPRPRTPIPVS